MTTPRVALLALAALAALSACTIDVPHNALGDGLPDATGGLPDESADGFGGSGAQSGTDGATTESPDTGGADDAADDAQPGDTTDGNDGDDGAADPTGAATGDGCPEPCAAEEDCIDGVCVPSGDSAGLACAIDPMTGDAQCDECLADLCCDALEGCLGDGVEPTPCSQLSECLAEASEAGVFPECETLTVDLLPLCAEAACPETANQLGNLLQIPNCRQINCAASCA